MRRPPPITNPKHYAACLKGEAPAEVLPSEDRAHLVWRLHAYGWTDVQIAELTSMTTYTAARIRSRMGLAPNEARKGAA